MAFDYTACLARARQLLAQQPLNDALLQFFRDQGASMLDVREADPGAPATSLTKAQDIVHNSSVWADHYDSHQRLQEDFAIALLELGGKLEDL